jgi:membrane-associated protein
VHYTVVILIITLASILGNFVGYWFGAKYGHKLYEKEDTLLFKKKHLIKAHDFYERYGKSTVFLSKFLPIIRTFVPIVAGMVDMNKKDFALFNIMGSFVWVFSMMLGGHFLQGFFVSQYHYNLKDHIEVITIGIILVTTLPVLYKMFFGKKQEETPLK